MSVDWGPVFCRNPQNDRYVSSLLWLTACCELWIYLASELLFFIFNAVAVGKKYSICIDKRIAILEDKN